MASVNFSQTDVSIKMVTGTGSLMGCVWIYGQLQLCVTVPHSRDNTTYMFPFQARGNANLKAPPPSKHFSDDKKLRLPPTPTSAAPPASASASASLTDPMALLQQLVQQNAAMMMFASSFNPLALASSIGVGVAPFASTTALGSSASVPSVSATPNSATSSPSNVLKLPRSISVEEFSVHYNISDSDRLKLVTLEVHLGDHAVEKLEPEYWKEVGFSKLGWDRFLAAHRQFIMDVRNGIWG